MRLNLNFTSLMGRALLLSAICASSVFGVAQNVAASSCDSDYRDMLDAQATAFALRENEMAEMMFMGRTSVLEYTCFTIDPPLEDAIDVHLATNYPGALCVTMSDAWHGSKCSNFDKLDFKSFSEMQGGEFRGSSCPSTAGYTEAPKRPDLWSASGPVADAETVGTLIDAIDNNINEAIFWFSGSGTDCSDSYLVPTGLEVKNDDGSPYLEYSCSLAGCYYDGSQCELAP